MEHALTKVLNDKNVSQNLIDDIINSGYILKHWTDFTNSEGYTTISDKMYGNKQHSSSFEIEKFIKYAKGENTFEPLPKFRTYKVKNKEEIEEIFNEYPRNKFIENGQMSFRGQVKEYTFKRKIPNPLRSDEFGNEISILPGALRNKDLGINSSPFKMEQNSIAGLLRELEPNNPDIFSNSFLSKDMMRVEQHYAKQTYGLDISFDIETAIFFATNKLNWNDEKKAYHSKIKKGEHQGVIYSFVFRDPPVKITQYLINDFDLFKTYPPERILRQKCGLPLFSDYDRNIAICDIDCIIYLDTDFDYNSHLTSSYMFPNEKEDKFYGKLIELKRKFSYPELDNIVEYK